MTAKEIAEGIVEEDCECNRCTLARAYLALLPPSGAWSHDEGDVVLTHPDGSTERFYAGNRAPYVVAACSRYEALVSDLTHAVGECNCQLTLALPSMVRTEPEAHTAAIARLRVLGGTTCATRRRS